MWYNYHRGPRYRGFMFFPFMMLFWFIFASHSFVGIFLSIMTFFIVAAIISAVMRSATAHAPSQTYYQPNQRQQQAYYEPTYRAYEQGYQVPQERYVVDADRPRESVQYEQPAQYEQPKAQYPEQMPPMQ